jgi:hypothetical protein
MTEEGNAYTTVITLTYDPVTYTDEEIAILRTSFLELGSVRTRGLYEPAAGAGIDISVVIEFVGLAAASGIVGHLATKVYEGIVQRIKDFYGKKNGVGTQTPNSIHISYDDLEFQLTLVSDEVLDDLPQLAEQIHWLVTSRDNDGQSIHRVIIPVEYLDGEWHGINLSNPSGLEYKNRYRYWHVDAWDVTGTPRIYDSEEREFVETPDPDNSLPSSNEDALLEDLLAAPLDIPEHTSEAPILLEVIPMVCFLEPDVNTKKRDIIDVHMDNYGQFSINGVTVSSYENYGNSLGVIQCADGTSYYVHETDLLRLPQG